MAVENKTVEQNCRGLLVSFFMKPTTPRFQIEADRVLEMLVALEIPMPGKPGGWAAGIIYALANQRRRACGIPGHLNKELEEFFNVSMGTIYKRAAKIKNLLMQWSLFN